MKKLCIYLLACYLPIGLLAQTAVSGKITYMETGEELIGANLQFSKEGVFITGTSTDFNGNYKVNLDPGIYDVTTSYIGLTDKTIEGVIVKANQTTFLNVEMDSESGGIVMDEIIVTDYKVPLMDKDNTTSGGIITSQQISRLPRRSRRKKRKRKKKRLPTKNISSIASSTSGLSTSSSNTKSNKDESPGQLTAGEWKDLDHWTFWNDLLKNPVFSNTQKHWGYYPTNRFSVILSDLKARPLVNVVVNLLNDADEVVWEARTDNRGSAELWGNFYGEKDHGFKMQIKKENIDTIISALPYSSGINSIRLPLDCAANKFVDIAFVVDATASMTDEIRHLKAEITDVIQQTEAENAGNFRCGSVFYTDFKYPNPIQHSAFTKDHDVTIDFVKTRTNRSGSATVGAGLSRAIDSLGWKDDAIAKIIFLMFDEAPSYRSDLLADLQKTIKKAAQKGIKIIPMAGSGTNKNAEFLFKFFAIATNGTYTFLTDHSGIGNAHIEPEAKDYNVETLNDLLLRIISENSEYHDCAPQTMIAELAKEKEKIDNYQVAKTKKTSNNKKVLKQFKCFPNPATDHLFIDLDQAADLVLVTTIDGRIIDQFPKVKKGQMKINVSDWPSGICFVHFVVAEKRIVKKVIVNSAENRVGVK